MKIIDDPGSILNSVIHFMAMAGIARLTTKLAGSWTVAPHDPGQPDVPKLDPAQSPMQKNRFRTEKKNMIMKSYRRLLYLCHKK